MKKIYLVLVEFLQLVQCFCLSVGLSVFEVSFCGLIKGISPKNCILCVHVKINKHLFEPFCVLIQNYRLTSQGLKVGTMQAPGP